MLSASEAVGVDVHPLDVRRQRQRSGRPSDARQREHPFEHVVEVVVGPRHDAHEHVAGAGDLVGLDDLGDLRQPSSTRCSLPWTISNVEKASTW